MTARAVVRAPVREHAPAKVNLALAVTGQREDGYHLIDTIAVFADLGDTLSAEAHDGLHLEVAGPFAGGLERGSDNLVLRAARLLAGTARSPGRTRFGARLFLTKSLPVAAGLGGGSADAAATLRALNRLWGLGLTPARLAGIGAALGADVAMCVHSRALRARGIGERVELLDAIPALPMVLVNPRVPLVTAEVFAAHAGPYAPGLPDPPHFPHVQAAAEWLAPTANDLQAAAGSLCAEIGIVLSALDSCPGRLVSRMSGSGATCFALFAEERSASEAAHRLAAAHPGWWVAATMAR